jgi:glutathione S-transferase
MAYAPGQRRIAGQPSSSFHAPFWPVVMPYRYTTDESEAAQQAVVETGYKLVAEAFAVLSRHLDDREHILDEGRSVIDAYSSPMIR